MEAPLCWPVPCVPDSRNPPTPGPWSEHLPRSCPCCMAEGWRYPAQGSGGQLGTAHRPQPASHQDSGGWFP